MGASDVEQPLFQAAGKRADKLRAKGKVVDFIELIRMEPDGGVTNVRNTSSKHWTRWLGIENRCVVPFTRFAEPDPASKAEGRPNAERVVRGQRRPAADVLCRTLGAVRKVNDGIVTADLFGFRTTEPNGGVARIHQKAMPVILRPGDEIETC